MTKKHLILLPVLAFVVSGCGTIPLPSAPDSYSFVPHAGSKTIGVLKVKDLRPNDKAGNVSLYGLKLERKAFEDFVTDHLLYTLNSDMKVNVMRVGDDQKASGVDLLLKGTIEHLDIFSIDSLLHPAEAKFRFNIALYNSSGEQVYNNTYESRSKKWIGLNVNDKVYGEMVDEIVKEAFKMVADDSTLMNHLSP